MISKSRFLVEKPEARIVNGADARPLQWPWAVYLRIAHLECGGSVISSRHILTTTHCVIGYNASQMTVYAGSHKRGEGSQIRQVPTITMHPSYNSCIFLNDIAILELSAELNMADPAVKSIELSSAIL